MERNGRLNERLEQTQRELRGSAATVQALRRGGTQHALTEANEKLEKANAEFQRRVTALEGRAREAEAALQESLQRQEKMAAMYEESILERASEEAAECEEVPR